VETDSPGHSGEEGLKRMFANNCYVLLKMWFPKTIADYLFILDWRQNFNEVLAYIYLKLIY